VYRAGEDGVFDLLTSEWLLEELRRASRYPKLRRYVKPHEAEVMVGGLRLGTLVLAELPKVDEVAPDPDDNPLLATALAGEADYLVSGDKSILGLGRLGNARILTPRSFLDEVIKPSRNP
jgi:uncharacterized protein